MNRRYFQEPHVFAVTHINIVPSPCFPCPIARMLLSRPNFHRLEELDIRTIPVLGHGLFLSDMTLKVGRQPLKLFQSNNIGAEVVVSAVYKGFGTGLIRKSI